MLWILSHTNICIWTLAEEPFPLRTFTSTPFLYEHCPLGTFWMQTLYDTSFLNHKLLPLRKCYHTNIIPYEHLHKNLCLRTFSIQTLCLRTSVRLPSQNAPTRREWGNNAAYTADNTRRNMIANPLWWQAPAMRNPLTVSHCRHCLRSLGVPFLHIRPEKWTMKMGIFDCTPEPGSNKCSWGINSATVKKSDFYSPCTVVTNFRCPMAN